MGTTQEAISRMEAGRRLPNVSFVDRYAKAIGRSIPLVFGESRSASSQERRRRVERALGKDAFNPWDRNPAPPEVESLLADGLTRERFDSQRTAGVEDLYLDRIRQTTMYPPGSEPTEFKGAVAVAVASHEDFDWKYVDQEIKTTEQNDPSLGKDMREVHNRARRRLLFELKR